MRRATLLMASGLAAATVAGMFLYGRVSRVDAPVSVATPSATEVIDPQVDRPPLPALQEAEPNVSTSSPTESTAAEEDPRRVAGEAYERSPRRPPRDEATILAEQRTQARRDIRRWYSLLLDDLELTPEQQEELVNVLAELQVDAAWIGGQGAEWTKRGRTIGAQERHERIAAAIGEEKLDEFLVLEVNLASYSESQQIASLLQRKDVPLTKMQRDGVFEILVGVRERYPYMQPDFDPRSLDYIEHRLAWLDDFDRHVMELAPSVLSATQVAHLSDEYQWMARQRIDSIEMQTKRRAERPAGGVGWAVPARWNPH